MNRCTLIGKITKELELRHTQNGKATCEFTLAINRTGQDGADFINCTVWNKQAENLCKYQSKGSLLAVIGELRTDTYEVNNEKRYKTYVLVNNIEFLGSKNTQKKDDIPIDKLNAKTKMQQQFEYSESDLPFGG